MREQLLELLGTAIHQWGVMLVSDINFDESWRVACQSNACGKYNKSWNCPPAVGEIAELKQQCCKFQYAFVFTTMHQLEDQYDFEGMTDGKHSHEVTQQLIEQYVRLHGGRILGAGSCDLCSKCTYPDSPCRHPDRVYVSIEACGISVCHVASHLNINYINGENTVTYFTMVLYN